MSDIWVVCSAPQPIIFEKHGIINKPVIYEILANEGPETGS